MESSLGTDVYVGNVKVTENRSVGINPALIDYSNSNEAIFINVATGESRGGTARGDVLINVPAIRGSGYADTIIGDQTTSLIDGGAGNDIIYADKSLISQSSFERTTVRGGLGADIIYSKSGSILVDYSTSTASVTLNFRTGIFSGADAEGDQLINVFSANGSDFNDTIVAGDTLRGGYIFSGGAGKDHIEGGRGNDLFNGDSGDDALFGGAGADLLSGGNENDLLIETDGGQMKGGDGNDRLVSVASAISSATEMGGGTGADMFILTTEKSNQTSYTFKVTVNDFSHSDSDKIDLSDLRDGSGNILDLQDILDHSAVSGGNFVINLDTFRSNGHSVSGTLTLEGIGSSSSLVAADFIFSSGVDWAAAIPSDISLY